MQKDFDRWNKRKKELHVRNYKKHVHNRDIWWCALGVNIEHEEDGKHERFERPVLVIRRWGEETAVVLPLTTKIKRDRYHFIFRHKGVAFAIILSQVRLVSTQRMERRIRKLGRGVFTEVLDTFIALLENERTRRE